jgi:hypothetical protein
MSRCCEHEKSRQCIPLTKKSQQPRRRQTEPSSHSAPKVAIVLSYSISIVYFCYWFCQCIRIARRMRLTHRWLSRGTRLVAAGISDTRVASNQIATPRSRSAAGEGRPPDETLVFEPISSESRFFFGSTSRVSRNCREISPRDLHELRVVREPRATNPNHLRTDNCSKRRVIGREHAAALDAPWNFASASPLGIHILEHSCDDRGVSWRSAR